MVATTKNITIILIIFIGVGGYNGYQLLSIKRKRKCIIPLMEFVETSHIEETHNNYWCIVCHKRLNKNKILVVGKETIIRGNIFLIVVISYNYNTG